MSEDEMTLLTLDERRKYLKRVWPRYAQGNREERSALLSEMEQVTGMQGAMHYPSDEDSFHRLVGA
jgi:hypothetical protein